MGMISIGFEKGKRGKERRVDKGEKTQGRWGRKGGGVLREARGRGDKRKISGRRQEKGNGKIKGENINRTEN
jgi:hypothetical protein